MIFLVLIGECFYIVEKTFKHRNCDAHMKGEYQNA
jgi:hypothetical protein